jgi:hypothetical protein|nr:MAG TPA: hypothetical protein [Caudoviricetes sp.]
MKVDTLLENIQKTYFKHSSLCQELTDYIINNVVEDMDDYEFQIFAVFQNNADGVALSMEILEDKKHKIDNYYVNKAKVCNIERILSIFKNEKRKVTIKEIFNNRF